MVRLDTNARASIAVDSLGIKVKPPKRSTHLQNERTDLTKLIGIVNSLILITSTIIQWLSYLKNLKQL